MRKIDVIAQVRAERGETREAVVAELEYLADQAGPGARADMLQELSDEQALQVTVAMRRVLDMMDGLTPGIRAQILSEATGVTFSEADMAAAQARGASYEYRERLRALEKATCRPAAGEFKRNLMRTGAAVWPVALQGRDPDDLIEAAHRLWDKAKKHGDENFMLAMKVPEVQRSILFAARWAHFAFPVVQLQGHRYAAALMSTQPAPDEPKLPWPTFLLEVPLGLITTIGQDGTEQPIEAVFVSRYAKLGSDDIAARWHVQAIAIDGTSLHRWDVRFEELFVKGGDLPTIDSNPAFQMQYDARDDRVWWLLARLLANTCIAMSDPNEVHELGRGKKSGGPTVPGNPDTSKIYRVGHAVEVDCRPAVQEYLYGIRRSGPTVRFVVRGHWRDQACGSRLSERRQKWIEPYWKGPGDGAINVRPHVLKENSEPTR